MTTDRIPLFMLDPAGASDGDSPQYDAAAGRVAWAAGGAGAQTIREALTAAADDQVLTLGGSPIAGTPYVWVSGVLLWPSIDYTISGTVITLDTPLTAGDAVWVSYQTTDASPPASTLDPAVVTYDTAALDLGPVAYFTFSEATTAEWADTSGNSKTVTVASGAPTASDSGGPVLSGGLTSGYVDVNSARLSTNVTQPNTTTAYTICGWYKGTQATRAIIASARGSSGKAMSLWLSGAPVNGGGAGTINCGVSANSVWSGRKTAATINDNTWRWFAATFACASGTIPTSAFADIYIDGAVVATSDAHYASTTAPLDSAGTGFQIGANANEDGPNGLSGKLSRLAFFDRKLSTTELAGLHAAAAA